MTRRPLKYLDLDNAPGDGADGAAGVCEVGEDLRAILKAAGLEHLGTELSAAGMTPEAAWRMVISGSATPRMVVPDDADDYLKEVDRTWESLATDLGLLAGDGIFLLSLPGPGAMRNPWIRTRLAAEVRLAEVLAPYPGEPEFVTASVDGFPILGVTSEEEGIWMVALDG